MQFPAEDTCVQQSTPQAELKVECWANIAHLFELLPHSTNLYTIFIMYSDTDLQDIKIRAKMTNLNFSFK